MKEEEKIRGMVRSRVAKKRGRRLGLRRRFWALLDRVTGAAP
jgi:hypothetical protein